MVRETPLNLAHLRNMTSATEMGAIVFPPLPAFYHRPTTVDEIVDDTVERVVALMGIAANVIAKYIERYRWIAWVGLLVIVYVAGSMIYTGITDQEVGLISLFGTRAS